MSMTMELVKLPDGLVFTGARIRSQVVKGVNLVWLELRGTQITTAVDSTCKVVTSLNHTGERWYAPALNTNNYLPLSLDKGDQSTKLQMFNPPFMNPPSFVIGGGFKTIAGCNGVPGVGLVWNTTSSTLGVEALRASCLASKNAKLAPTQ